MFLKIFRNLLFFFWNPHIPHITEIITKITTALWSYNFGYFFWKKSKILRTEYDFIMK